MAGRGYHDIGGGKAGPVRHDEFPFSDWQKLSEAMRGALEANNRIVSLDEIRRVFETFGEDLYSTLGFYERRAEALTLLLDEKGIVAARDVKARMDAIAASRHQIVDHAAKTVSPITVGSADS
ncbi:MAG: nitrile hydratase [Rhodomicrobium sp.]